MTIALFWGEFGPEASQYLSTVTGVTAQRWQGIREPATQLWFVQRAGADSQALDELMRHLAGAGIQQRALSAARQWKSTDAEVANFVLRELRPESIDAIVPQIHGQIEAVADRPGCVGCTLAAEIGKPQNLLGGTYWEDQDKFDRYVAWASQHAWRDVISPVTLAVPLRLLTRRMD